MKSEKGFKIGVNVGDKVIVDWNKLENILDVNRAYVPNGIYTITDIRLCLSRTSACGESDINCPGKVALKRVHGVGGCSARCFFYSSLYGRTPIFQYKEDCKTELDKDLFLI